MEMCSLAQKWWIKGKSQKVALSQIGGTLNLGGGRRITKSMVIPELNIIGVSNKPFFKWKVIDFRNSQSIRGFFAF